MNRYNTTFNGSTLEVIVGTMYSGKSRELLHRGERAEKFGNIPVYYFKPRIDTRDGANISSRDGIKKPSILFENSSELLDYVGKEVSLVLIDEAQFCDENIVYVSQLLRNRGYNVVLSGLPNDYRGQPFAFMPQLMALSDTPIKTIYSVCSINGCHNDGTLPQRLRNDEPDSALSLTVIIEGSDNEDKIDYEPRCEDHHKVPDIEEYLESRLNRKEVIKV